MDRGTASGTAPGAAAGSLVPTGTGAAWAPEPVPGSAVRGLPAARLRASLRRLLRALRLAPGLLRTWHQRARQRAHLAELDAHLLRDIGITRPQARRESDKWFWEP